MTATLTITPHPADPSAQLVTVDCVHATTEALYLDGDGGPVPRGIVALTVAKHGRCRCGRRLARRLGCG